MTNNDIIEKATMHVSLTLGTIERDARVSELTWEEVRQLTEAAYQAALPLVLEMAAGVADMHDHRGDTGSAIRRLAAVNASQH